MDVLKAYYNTNDEIIWQEMALYKVPTDAIAEKVKVERLLREFGARAVAIRKDYTVFETTGHREETDKLIAFLEPFGLIEFVRSARVAIIKESSGFHDKVKEFEKDNQAKKLWKMNTWINRKKCLVCKKCVLGIEDHCCILCKMIVEKTIPVLRIFDYQKAIEFYIDWLEFASNV